MKRSNRQNTLPRDALAIRLRRQRLNPLATVPQGPSPVGIDGIQEGAGLAIDIPCNQASDIPSVESPVTPAEIKEAADFGGRALEASLSARIIELRDQLLEQLQSSFAGLRADQEFAWSEQTALLKSLSADVGEAIGAGQVQRQVPAPVSVKAVTRSPAERSEPKRPEQPVPRGQSVISKPTMSGSAQAGALQRWEAIRQNFLETDGADLLNDHGDSVAASQKGSDSAQSEFPVAVGKVHAPIFAPGVMGTSIPRDSDAEFAAALPEPIDESTLSDSELREVFRCREQIIADVIGRYRRRREDSTPLLSAEQLRGLEDSLPDVLTPLVAESLRRIDELTRLGEVEMAFERARLSRERKQLEQSRFLLEHQARQMGLTLNPDGSLERTDLSATRQKERRWLGKLGFGNQQS